MKFLWEVGALRDKKCSPWGNCFLWTVLPGSTNFILMKPSNTSMIEIYFKTKAELRGKNDAPYFFGRVKISYVNYVSHLKENIWHQVIASSNLLNMAIRTISLITTTVLFSYLWKTCYLSTSMLVLTALWEWLLENLEL